MVKLCAVVSMRTVKGREATYWPAAVTVKHLTKWLTGMYEEHLDKKIFSRTLKEVKVLLSSQQAHNVSMTDRRINVDMTSF